MPRIVAFALASEITGFHLTYELRGSLQDNFGAALGARIERLHEMSVATRLTGSSIATVIIVGDEGGDQLELTMVPQTKPTPSACRVDTTVPGFIGTFVCPFDYCEVVSTSARGWWPVSVTVRALTLCV